MKSKMEKYINNEYNFDKLTTIGIYCLIIVIGGMLGFIYELIFYYFNDGMEKFYFQGGNFLPWINIYAIGAILIYILTFKERKSPFKVFLIGLIACGLLEFFSGLGIYLLCDGKRYWDYNVEILNFGNIGGFICFRSVFFFGIASMAFIYIVMPICFYLAKHMNKKTFVTLSVTLCSIFLLDEFYNLLFARVLDLPTSIQIYKKIGLRK